MSKINEDHLQMVKDCEDRESLLDEWETGFISSIRDRLENGKSLTDTQEEKLDKIWDKVTQNG